MKISDVVIGEPYAVEANGKKVTAIEFVQLPKGEYTDVKIRGVKLRDEHGHEYKLKARFIEPWAEYSAQAESENAEYDRDIHAIKRLNGAMATVGIEGYFGVNSVEPGFYVHIKAEALEQIADLLSKAAT